VDELGRGLGTRPDPRRLARHHGRGRNARAACQHDVFRDPHATDETADNVAGVGKPPWSWRAALAPADVLHKAV
jgi:hypothetical protein